MNFLSTFRRGAIAFAFPLIISALSASESLIRENIPEFPPELVERIYAYQSTRSAGFQDWDPRGDGMIILTRFGEVTQAHAVETAGGARRQLTFFREPLSGVRFPPGPDQGVFYFSRDIGGNENFQIFRFFRESGTVEMITDGQSRNGGLTFSRDGQSLVYYSTARNGTDWDIYLASASAPSEAAIILQAGGFWFPIDFSPCDSQLLLGRAVSVNESYRYLLDLETLELRELTPPDRRIGYGSTAWSADGKGIFWTHNEESEFRHLRYLNLRNGEETILTGEIPWDVERLLVHPERPILLFVINAAGISQLHQINLESGEIRELPGFETGLIGRMEWHPDGDRFALNFSSARTPGDIYVYHLESETAERWTFSEVGGLNTETFTLPRLVHFPTFDEVAPGQAREISAFVFEPSGPGPHPVVIQIHGGPESQYRPGFSSLRQFWIDELGLALIAPNVRGSTGYGRAFVDLDNGFKREDSVRDIGALLDWIETQPSLDSARVAVYGGSYGGYMVLASLIHFGERLRAGVNIVGISDFITFLRNTGDYRRDLRRVEYGDERDPEMYAFLRDISPVNNAHRIVSPLFVVQGYNDPRVPVGQAEQILEAVRANGLEPWYLLAMDEGHGFRRRSNADFFQTATALFFLRYLRDNPEFNPDLVSADPLR
jgi:protease II